MRAGAGSYILVGVGTAVVIAAVIAGLMVLGSPAKERERRMDERRVEQLGELGRVVDFYRSKHGRLPSSLDELEREGGSALGTRDPGTQQAYEFRVLDTDKYELCAQFQQASRTVGFWRHGAGRQCFALTVREVFR